MCGSHHRLRVDVELLVNIGDLSRSAEGVRADEAAYLQDWLVEKSSR
jgi:hypothetical protein